MPLHDQAQVPENPVQHLVVAASRQAMAIRAARVFCRLVLVLCLASFPARVQAQGFPLELESSLDTGNDPYGVAVADLNGDGKVDIVCTNYYEADVAVYLGTGGGAFGVRTNFATGANPVCVAIADLNGDGKPDLAVVDAGSDKISVLFGNGSGGFGPRTDFAVGSFPLGVAIGDLNLDGKLDLAVTSYNANVVSVLLGDGAGSFGPRTDFAAGAGARGVAIGDVNGDGKPDLVVSNQAGNSVSYLPGNGAGAFPTRTDYAVGVAPFTVALGDLNGDGILDLATADFNSNTITTLLGNGSGFASGVSHATGANPQTVLIVDVNSDSKADLVVTEFGSRTIATLLGDGAGGFAARSDLQTGYNPQGLASADLNDDGRIDLVVANGTSYTITLLEGEGAKVLQDGSLVGSGTNYAGVALADVNLDGKLDLVAGGSNVTVWLGNGTGGLGAPITSAVLGAVNPTAMAVGNFMSLTKPSVAVCDQANQNVIVMVGHGDGTFAELAPISIPSTPVAIAAGDLNHDGIADIVVAASDGSLTVLTPTGSTLVPRYYLSANGNAYGIAIADLNGDGLPDVVMEGDGPNGIAVLLNTGGSLGSAAHFAAPPGPRGLAIADIDGDGNLDLVVGSGVTDSLYVLPGNGAGSFGFYFSFQTIGRTASLATGDIDGDGRTDVVQMSQDIGGAIVLPGGVTNLGVSHFPWLGPPEVSRGASSLDCAVGDLDGDGRLDVIGSSSHPPIVFLHSQSPQMGFGTNPAAPIAGTPFALTVQVTPGPPGTGVPGGTVAVFDGTTSLGTSSVVSGTATVTLPSWTYPGARTYWARYSGDSHNAGKISSPFTTRAPVSPSPGIVAVQDVESDQGGQVGIAIAPSPLDAALSLQPIVRYDVYRRDAASMPAKPGVAARVSPSGAEITGWNLVGSQTANAGSAYRVVVPTIADSNATGTHWAVFLVRAATANSSVYYDSAPDSGYSIDNTAPPVPAPFTGAYAYGATHLHWGANSASDFAEFRLYRDPLESFTPGPGNLVTTSPDTGFVDPGAAGSFYKLSAVDVNGNESGFAALTPAQTTSVVTNPLAFELEGVTPSPARSAELSVHFALPSAASARLDLLDIAGRRVLTQEVGGMGAGSHLVDWSSHHLRPGLYLIRLTQERRAASLRVVVLQ